MNALALFVTFASLALAAGMAVVAYRVVREERQRSDARVAALSELAAGTIWERDMPDFLPEPEDLDPAAEFSDVEESRAEPVGTLFAEPAAASPCGARTAIAGGVGVLVLAIGVAGTAWHSSGTRPAQSAAPAAPLELVSLRHTQSGGTLTVSGRVQNPSGAATTADLTATVFLFGSDGSFLTSGRAPLDVPRLRPGGESAFVVPVPVNGAVARYRVSFRDSSGHPVGHVDKRSPDALARNQ